MKHQALNVQSTRWLCVITFVLVLFILVLLVGCSSGGAPQPAPPPVEPQPATVTWTTTQSYSWKIEAYYSRAEFYYRRCDLGRIGYEKAYEDYSKVAKLSTNSSLVERVNRLSEECLRTMNKYPDHTE